MLDEYKGQMSTSMFESSISYGDSVGNHIVKWSKKDSFAYYRGREFFLTRNKPGSWEPTPPDFMEAIEPNWGKIRPVLVKSVRDFTWEKQAQLAHDRLKVIYSENFKDGKFIKKQVPKISNHFVNKAYVQVDKADEDIKVEFWDKKTDKLLFETKLKEGHWAAPNKTYFVDWKIIAKDTSGEVVFQHEYDAAGKRVYIALESKSLGDTLAWFPQLEEFRKKHNCKLIASTFWNHFFEGQYPEIEFIKPGTPVDNLYAMYKVGWFYDGDKINLDHNPVDPKSRPLQATASDILGLEYKEVVPKIIKPERPNRYGKKFVCFSPHASASAKYWHNEQGWQAIINYIKNGKSTPGEWNKFKQITKWLAQN